MAGSALCRTESGACGDGRKAGKVAVVECCGTLRLRESRSNIRNGALAEPLERARVAFVSGRGGVGERHGCAATLHSHGPAPREFGVCGRVGSLSVAPTRSEKKRASGESRPRSAPAQPYLSCLAKEMGYVPSVPDFIQLKFCDG